MKKLLTLFLASFCLCAVTASFADVTERLKAAGEKTTGATQEAVGDLTGDAELKAKGKLNKAKGNLRNVKEDTKDKAKKAIDENDND